MHHSLCSQSMFIISWLHTLFPNFTLKFCKCSASYLTSCLSYHAYSIPRIIYSNPHTSRFICDVFPPTPSAHFNLHALFSILPALTIPSAVHSSYFICCSRTTCFVMHALFPIPRVLFTVLFPFFFIFFTTHSVPMLHSAYFLLYTSWVIHGISLNSLLYCDSLHVILHAAILVYHSPSLPTILHVFTPCSILPST